MMSLSGFGAILDTSSVQTDSPPSLPLSYPPFLPSLRGAAKVIWGQPQDKRSPVALMNFPQLTAGWVVEFLHVL